MRSLKHHRSVVKGYRRAQQRQALLDGFIDFLFMIFGISLITGTLIFLLTYWSY
ncbi:hypothetical protein WAK64_20225 [Bacillus spongiae]|uniref:YqzM family protein n=1 Tax=Bacillus spongiae TaxID=2683610 RepID=A0ABU8HIZ3_9BACI